MSHDVFVSYPSEDKPTADAVVAALEAGGVRCWYAPRDVEPGADWAASIIGAVRASRLTILVFSEAANASRHILREVRQAADTGIPVLPFRITHEHPSDSLTYYIGDTHWLDALSPPLEDHLERLVETVRARLGEAPLDDVPFQDRPREPRLGRPPGGSRRGRSGSPRMRSGVVAAGVAIVAVAVVALVSLGGDTTEPAASSPTSTTISTVTASTEATSTTEPVTSTTSGLPALAWIHNPVTDHYYGVTESGLSWNELNALAAEYGGYLVSIGDASEEEWLYSYFGQDLFWIGLNDLAVEGEWVWTSGEPVTYLNWCPGEPTDNVGAGTEDAVHTYPFLDCWNDDLAWATEFLVDNAGNMIPSFPGVIELDHEPPP
jgi:hypothetical protein